MDTFLSNIIKKRKYNNECFYVFFGIYKNPSFISYHLLSQRLANVAGLFNRSPKPCVSLRKNPSFISYHLLSQR